MIATCEIKVDSLQGGNAEILPPRLLIHGNLAVHAPVELGLLGLRGGDVYICRRGLSQYSYWLNIVFEFPGQMPEKVAQDICDFCRAQMSDGFGESGIYFNYQNTQYTIEVDGESNVSITFDSGGIESAPHPIFSAIYNSNWEMALSLLAGNGYTADRVLGYSLAQWAILYGNGPVINLVFDRMSEVNELDGQGNTLLHLLVVAQGLDEKERESILRKLVSRGALTTIRDQSGVLPSELAEELGKTSLLKALSV